MNSNYDNNPSITQMEEWARVQTELKLNLIETDDLDFTKTIKEDNGEQVIEFNGLNYIGGVDLSFENNENNEESAIASLIVLKYPSLEVIYENFSSVKLELPYIAGFLAFREVAPLLDLLQNLKKMKPNIFPQVIIVDGNGTLHPRRFGLASHLGVLANVPTIGVGKNFLQIDDGETLTMAHVKATVKEKLKKGGDTYLLQGQSGMIWGAAVRSLDHTTNPIFVSVGHRISLETSIQIVLKCCRYRIPEPTRQADIRSREYIRNHIS
ncbi:endonuclease V-domain-containing protein [Glomus cerebriforme]|uniref:Endonuclease V-domain-containing protein n=1 Tax=Glomus cerebriforme TaxID=658196 RepID=A0A397TG61_9GLOM|nr:endonuclease V-domain-containing protein [Glomus cerebriforme]